MGTARRDVDVAVIGAGQAGLSAAFHLRRKGLDEPDGLVVLDRNRRPGGAWQHRWPTLRTADVHGIHRLPGRPAPDLDPAAPARDTVPAYFADYERNTGIHVHRPVTVDAVRESGDGRLDVDTDAGGWRVRALVNATGTWDLPFVPHYPGIERFRGRSLHTADYRGPAEFAGQRVLVVGGGASAVQLLAELSTVAHTTWVTRRPPRWRTGEPFTAEIGRAAVALVDQRVRAGLPPGSVVSVTGLRLREQELAAAARGVYHRQPMFERIEPAGVRWSDGSFAAVDAIVWCTGFRPAHRHLAPLRLREPGGGIRMDGTQVARDPRIHLVGYGPSASTIGASRAGRQAAIAITELLGQPAQPPTPDARARATSAQRRLVA